MSTDKPKVDNALSTAERWPIEESRLRAERKALRVKKRQTRLASALVEAQLVAVQHHDLKKHVFKTDEQLRALKLTEEQILLVRKWEEPKRHTAFALESSSSIVTSLLRKEGEKQKITLNIENMNFVQLPPKQQEEGSPKVIDVNPVEK